jgi:hypothetical protein
MTSGTRHRTRGREQRDANRRLQKRAAIVSGLLFTMKKPTATCAGGSAVMMRNLVDQLL